MYQTRNRWSVVWALLALLSALLALPPAWGQTDTARLQGAVADVTGGSVGGATVTVTNLGTNHVVAIQTESDGSYSVPGLPVGRYKIDVEKQNFKPVTREVTLQISQVAAVNFTLALGSVSEAVTVTAEAALVDSASSAMGDVVQSRPVTELPLNGRNFTQLATLIPGVTRGVPDGQATGAQGNAETFRYGNTGGAALSVNGLRPQANNFVLDGVDNNESLVNTVIFFPPAEAIEEFRVQTSVASAEFGRAGGAIVNTAIKSGTNEYHGSAFEFLRNSQLDARPTFAPQRNPFRRNQFGGTLGGPIVRNKLFVFGDYQGLRQFQPKSTDFATVPTAEFRNGNFSQLLNPALSGLSQPIAIRDLTTGQPFPGNIIPQARLNPAGQKYLNAFPMPNTNGGKVTQNYVTQRNETQSFNDFDIRTDWNIRESDQLFGRFSYGEADKVQRGVKEFEPHVAIFGGEHGLDIYKRLIPQALRVLKPGGWLVMEIGYSIGEALRALMTEFHEFRITTDLQGLPRVVSGRKKVR